MENLIILKKQNSPAINFHANGEMEIIGKSFVENAVDFYSKPTEWVRNITLESVRLKIDLIYANTASHKSLFNLLIALEENKNVKEVDVSWYYDSDDEEQLEDGVFLEINLSKCKFNYIPVEQVV